MTDIDPRREQLDALIARRDELRSKKGRVEGQLEEARKSLAAVEEESRKRKVPPEQLDATIKKLESRYDTAVEELEDEIKGAEKALVPFTEESHADSCSQE